MFYFINIFLLSIALILTILIDQLTNENIYTRPPHDTTLSGENGTIHTLFESLSVILVIITEFLLFFVLLALKNNKKWQLIIHSLFLALSAALFGFGFMYMIYATSSPLLKIMVIPATIVCVQPVLLIWWSTYFIVILSKNLIKRKQKTTLNLEYTK
ncbi:hypothetical protein MCSF7_02694 [Mycoplasmopsis columbina SF7]|uniref:Transmembrane protein n=1 Tax=Mycoplasmopsis columbina SF7 TaxID=1037410 RepID=F9UJ81_9BACT|nr:hypothetical protein MCSF7_02694 [Mycoplasmopsis columbina SF7]